MLDSSQPEDAKRAANDLSRPVSELTIQDPPNPSKSAEKHAMVSENTPLKNGAESADGQPHHSTPKDSKGWDGKLRIEKKTVLANPEAISDEEYSDEENVLPGDTLAADEGTQGFEFRQQC